MEQKLYISKCIKLLQCFAIRTELKRAQAYLNPTYYANRVESNEDDIADLQTDLAIANEQHLEKEATSLMTIISPDEILVTFK